MWILALNPMRGRAETQVVVARSETQAGLISFLKREQVEPYRDMEGGHSWNKVFRKGGPLEWYNPPFMGDIGDIGTREAFIGRAVAEAELVWDRNMKEVPEV